ncbi:hypothetical protein OVS_00875 [Mycoplasma ovis str. Michigan]|uniref:Uncharacterized protein n=1 Tax=Mycoplasma ovis str. Michigan TaxID=1415773 RepID=A0ABM5P193_9MOLU|nr:hypothetical protein [Mycoplasma ovis]AHC40160.1 hypothetical protein OVS_00875 [Mycoplasma ovis str. Michigan]
MLLSDSLLHFFLPDLTTKSLGNLESYLTSIQLEIVEYWDPIVKTPHPLKILSVSLADSQRYRYELLSLKTGNTFFAYSNLPQLDIDKVVFVSKKTIPNKSVIKDSEFLSFSDIFKDQSLDAKSPKPKAIPLIIDSRDFVFEELLKFNFFFPTRIYRLKQIYKYFDFSTIWVVAQELSLPANLAPKKFENVQPEDLFPSNSTGNLLMSIFLRCLNETSVNSYKEKLNFLVTHLFGDYVNLIFPQLENKFHSPKLTSQIKLKKLLPIFSELRENWEEKVVQRLSKTHFSLRSTGFGVKKKDEWEVCWPPWYLKNNLPTISELLIKLIPSDQSSKLLDLSNPTFTLSEFNPIELATETRQSIRLLTQIRLYLRNQGFVECNSVKFNKKDKNFKSPSIVLTSNTKASLRDNLHISLTQVLIENFNQSNNLYPIFELSYCPWLNIWKLGLAIVNNFSKTKEEKFNFYNLSLLKKLVIDLSNQVFNRKIEFEEIPLEHRYLPNWKASRIYKLVSTENSKELDLGDLLVFREEQLEIRKKELISINLNILH